MKLSVTWAGIGERPLVLLHGWGMGAAVWSRLLPLLESRYRLLIMDLPGYGDNVDVFADTLQDVATMVLDAVPDEALWLGWSLGGMVALRAAGIAPERVKELLLVASSPRFVQGDEWDHAMAASQLEQFAESLVSDVDATLKRFISLQFYGQEGVRDVSRALQQQVVGRPVARRALQQGLQWLGHEDLRGVYAGLTVPVRQVFGAADRLVPVKVAQDLARINGAVEQIVFKGVGHAPFVSHPELFVERLGL